MMTENAGKTEHIVL